MKLTAKIVLLGLGSSLFLVFGAATGFLVPNLNLPSDSLLVEAAMPLIATAEFAGVAGFMTRRATPGGAAAGGAVVTATDLVVLFAVLGFADAHFAAIGGARLWWWLPVFVAAGAVLALAVARVARSAP